MQSILYIYECWQVSQYLYAPCKIDLMQHGIPNTSGALSIFFLARTSCSSEQFRRYMTFMRLPWAPAHVAQTTETASAPWQQKLNTVEAKCERPTANVMVEIVQEWTKQIFKQKLVSADKKKKHMTRDDKKRGRE